MKSNIKLYRQRYTDLKAELRAMVDKAAGENRDLNEAEGAAYDEKLKALKSATQSLEREEALLELERATAPIEDQNEHAAAAAGAPGQKPGFKNFGEQLRAVFVAGRSDNRNVDPRLIQAAASGASEAVPSDGGFAVQLDFMTEIITRLFTGGELLSRVRRTPVNGNGLKINTVDEVSRVDGSRWGGVQAFWANEADTVTSKKPKFRRLTLELEKLMAIYYATDELIEDAAALGSIAMQAFQEELIFKAEDAIFEGDGSGKLLGIMNSGALITVNKETSQASTTLLSANVIKMWGRLAARSKKTAVWLVNTDVVPQLPNFNLPIKNVAGTENVGGIATPIYTFPTDGGPGRILGAPVVEIEYASSLGTLGDIVLCDLTQYQMIEKAGIQAASSMHVRFLNDEMAYRLTWRIDGEPIWNKPLTPFKGSNTTSPFVTLQAR